MRILKPDQERHVIELLTSGYGIRETSRLAGVHKTSVAKRYHSVFAEHERPRCPCGQLSIHQGWCTWRVQHSEKRQAFLKRWGFTGVFRSREPRLPTERSSPILFYPYVLGAPTPEHELILLAHRAVPAHLPESFRADICQDVIVAILSGEIAQDRLAESIPDVVRQAYRRYGTPFRQVSLDATPPWIQGEHPLLSFIGVEDEPGV